MELEQFQRLNLEKNRMIEYTVNHTNEIEKGTYLGYFVELIETVPKHKRQYRSKLPYVTIATHKDKNGCFSELQDIGLEDILYLYNLGDSNFSL